MNSYLLGLFYLYKRFLKFDTNFYKPAYTLRKGIYIWKKKNIQLKKYKTWKTILLQYKNTYIPTNGISLTEF